MAQIKPNSSEVQYTVNPHVDLLFQRIQCETINIYNGLRCAPPRSFFLIQEGENLRLVRLSRVNSTEVWLTLR